ncbi:PiggyBac transposable element-derived protein 4 [Plakobranchus ocellatus]|uniref:PiggyBac transposable element-derived protein 4 n=1 Tax=Plakobranchus ocellatus TaxID=259542 RepID=A0AAV4D5P7_9GAST|nr:PiggyBac transposable element-derived protein 4 [Plakobranchus ocellatus]
MFDRIVICTNKEGKRMHGDKWKETDSTDIVGFVGCLLHMFALKDSNSPTSVLWIKIDGNTLVKTCFSRERFLKISNAMRFVDKETRTARGQKTLRSTETSKLRRCFLF